MEVAICDVHDQCQEAFERLQEVLLKPKVDFNHALPLAAVRDEYGRFRVYVLMPTFHLSLFASLIF